MPLPTLSTPLFTDHIPSTGNQITFRPFLVREEKILLLAQQGSARDIFRSILQILGSCITDLSQEALNALPLFDIEYLFLRIRSKSVDNKVKITYSDPEDNKDYTFEINLDEVSVTGIDDDADSHILNNTIKIPIDNTEWSLSLSYPSASALLSLEENDPTDLLYSFVRSSITAVYSEDEYMTASDYTPSELNEFISSLPISTFAKIKTFFEGMPRLTHTITYTNSKGTARSIELSSLSDFFSWH